MKNVAKTIKESKAIKVYVSNIMTEPGQTDDYSISDHIDALIQHVGKGIADYCICDTGEVTPEFVRKYNKMGADIVEQDFSNASNKGMKIIQKDMSMIKGEFIRHNPDVIASTIIELICDDLKFKDKQNETQYVLLNSRLKNQKKKEKIHTHSKKIEKNIARKEERRQDKTIHKSKFSEKYKDRVKAIRQSEQTTMQNRKMLQEAENIEKRNKKKQNNQKK